MPRRLSVPTYRRKKISGLEYAVVTLRDHRTGRRRDVSLGPYGTAESRQRYAQLIAEWEAAGRRTSETARAGDQITVAELFAAHWLAREGELDRRTRSVLMQVTKLIRPAFGHLLATEFGPNAFRAARHAMLAGDPAITPPRPPWSHATVVSRCNRLVSIFRWGAAHELIPIAVYQALKAIEPVRCGTRTKICPVQPEFVQAARRHTSRQVAAMIDLQLLTGMRPGEVCAMRPCDIDMTGRVWLYRPARHKTEHHGHERIIYLGPRAKKILAPFMRGRATRACVFSPAEAEKDRRVEVHKRRKTPLSCGNRPGTNRKAEPQRSPGDHYTPDSYRRAIMRACDRANAEALIRARKRGANLQPGVRLVPQWHPHQLRHNYATEVRRQYGLEAAQILLGHASAQITDAVYAERDMTKAMQIAAEIG